MSQFGLAPRRHECLALPARCAGPACR
jgi:hypothetical protein